MAEAVKVIVRCRPLNEREKNLNCFTVVEIDQSRASCDLKNPNDKKAPPKRFTFDGAYDQNSTTEQIYAVNGFTLIEGVTEGYNGTIFAYGQTGCGKSFAMQGISNPTSQMGIIPRAFNHIFETIQVSENSKYLVHASYLEIYNEEIRDLLGKDIKMKLDLKENPDKGIYVQNLSKHACKHVVDCKKVMEKGWKNRSTGSTLMNAESSRSHSIFTVYLERFNKDENGEDHIKVAKLNLVDLAGSERQAKTGATGDRLKEATKINLSLSALGNVISALVDGKSTHVPYRDSKLTRLLQDSLGGNTKTLMIACLSPADNNYEETLSTLRYANRAKNIKNKPKINEDPKDAMLREYQEEIERLKAMLRGEIPVQVEGENKTDLENEKIKIKEKFDNETKKLKEELKSMKASKDMVETEMLKLKETYDKQLNELQSTFKKSKKESEKEKLGEKSKVVYVAAHKEKDEITAEDVAQRLKELQQNFVGGEQKNNEEAKEKRKRLKKFAEENNKKLQEALAKDSDEVVVGMFKTVQDELKYKNKLLEKEKEKSSALRCEIMDIQREFEMDRDDYLDSIRKQEKQIKFFQALIGRMHPLVRKDCNFSNLEKIKSLAEWDEINKNWILPKVILENNHLPIAVKLNSNNGKTMNGLRETINYDVDDLKFQQKLNSGESEKITESYFKSHRKEELLNASNNFDYSSYASIHPCKRTPLSPRLQEVHEENLLRKPIKLEAIKNPLKKKKQTT